MLEPFPSFSRLGSRRNSTRVGSPVVRVGPPGSPRLGEAPSGRVFPAWPLLFPSAHPRGSTFHGRSGRVYWRVGPGSVIFARDGLGWEPATTFQPPRPVSDARSLLAPGSSAEGRDSTGPGQRRQRRNSPRPSRPRPAALYLLQPGLARAWEQLPAPGAAKSPTPAPGLAVLPPGPSSFPLPPCLRSQNNNKHPHAPAQGRRVALPASPPFWQG